MSRVLLIALLVAPLVAHAEDRVPLTVEIGATVSREVGYAMGYLCDDESIAQGAMKNGTIDNNLFVVTGLKLGTTLCRAGTMQDRPTILYEVTVTPKPAAPAPRKKK